MCRIKNTRLYLFLGVLTLGCLLIGATQAEPMVPPRTTTVYLQNKTDKTLYLAHFAITKGSWTPNLRPPAVINPGESRYWKSEADGVANLSDISGNVRYSIGSATWNTPTTIAPVNTAKLQGSLFSISHSPDAIDVFFVAPDGSVQCVWYTVKVNKWSAPYVVAPAGSTRATTSITGVSRAPGHLDIFWITPKGEIASKAFANGKWGNVFNVTGPGLVRANMNLSVVSNDKNWIDVFYVGTDNALCSCSWRGAAWLKPTSHTPPTSVFSELAAITRTKDEIHVFYGNQESGISSIWWRGKWNGPAKVTEKSTMGSGSRIDAVAMNPKHLAIFWVNKSGALCTNYSMSDKDGGKWQGIYPISPEKGAEPGSPVVASNRTSTDINVFWRSPEGTVMASGFTSGGQWGKPYTISSPKAAFTKMTSASRVDHHIDVFWVDQKGSIVTNWWDSKSVPDIYISWSNPLVDSQYKNTYHEQAPLGYALSFTEGQGSHAAPKFVLEKSTKRVVSRFERSKHAFKFSNGEWKDKGIKLPVVSLDFPKPFGKVDITDSTKGLCGGMVYAVMDYFLANQEIPQTMTAPAKESDPLFQYLKQRLMTSWDPTGTGVNYIKFMRHDYPDADEGVVQGLGLMKGRSYIIAREEWPKVKADIDANRLSPIALVQVISYNPVDIGKNHQVLVYGYQQSGPNVTLFYYDPSFPNDDMELRFTIGDLSKRIDLLRFKSGTYSAKTINTFFRTTYKPAPSTLIRPKK